MNTTSTGRGRTVALIAVLSTAAIGLMGCSADSASESTSDSVNVNAEEVTTIRYQSYAGAIDPLLLADALGEFEGLTLERVGDVTGGPQALQALISDQTDIGTGAFYGAIAQVVASGAPIKAVLPIYGSNEVSDQKVVVLDDSPIQDARDLIGKQVAVNTLGAHAEALLDTWFDAEGLSEDEQNQITLVPLPSLNTPEALGNGQVDAAVVGFLSYEQLKAQFSVRELLNDIDVIGHPYAGGALTLRNEFIESNPNTSRQLVEGIAAAIEFIETHESKEIFDVYFPYLEQEGYGDYIEPIQLNFPGTLGVDANPVIADEDISRWSDWLVGRGDIEANDLDVSEVYTNELNPNA